MITGMAKEYRRFWVSASAQEFKNRARAALSPNAPLPRTSKRAAFFPVKRSENVIRIS